MELDTLQALYLEGLRDLYSAENQILKALPKMRKAATNPQLQDAFNTHLAQTEQQVTRLEQIFEQLGESPKGKHCKGMEGLLEEGSDLMKEDADPDVLDAGLISAAQHVEHYEMAGYGTCRTYAELLGFDDQRELLQQTLNEEGETDQLLTDLAMSSVNIAAMTGDDDEDSDEGDEGGNDEGARSSSAERSRTAGKTPAKKSVGGARGKTSTAKRSGSSGSRSK